MKRILVVDDDPSFNAMLTAFLQRSHYEVRAAHASSSALAELLELTGRARAMQEFTFQVFEAFTAATIIYVLVNIVVVFGMRWLERKVRVPGFIGTSATPVVAGH